ncbi:inner membrane-spanning protein YciB [Kangiella koreensis]|nr:septation protein IspZ [Kangiella koreensis]
MTFLKENYPIVAFIAVYLITKNLILAAAVWSAGSLVQILTSVLTKQPIKKSHIAYFVLGVLLVVSAYYFDDENFIKWKTSIILWAGSLVILFRQIFSKKYIIQDLLKANQVLKDTAPHSLLAKINWLWILYLTGFGFLNLYVAYTFSTDVWFWFKIIGLFASTMLLFIISIIMLKEHVNLDDPQKNGPDKKDSQE